MSDTDVSSGERLDAQAGEGHAGWRLDRFLSQALPGFSRSRLQQLLEQGQVALGGATVRDANYRVKPGDAFIVDVPPPVPATPQGQDIPLTVIYEDADLIVIDKPAGAGGIRRRAIWTAPWSTP